MFCKYISDIQHWSLTRCPDTRGYISAGWQTSAPHQQKIPVLPALLSAPDMWSMFPASPHKHTMTTFVEKCTTTNEVKWSARNPRSPKGHTTWVILIQGGHLKSDQAQTSRKCKMTATSPQHSKQHQPLPATLRVPPQRSLWKLEAASCYHRLSPSAALLLGKLHSAQ